MIQCVSIFIKSNRTAQPRPVILYLNAISMDPPYREMVTIASSTPGVVCERERELGSSFKYYVNSIWTNTYLRISIIIKEWWVDSQSEAGSCSLDFRLSHLMTRRTNNGFRLPLCDVEHVSHTSSVPKSIHFPHTLDLDWRWTAW